MTAIDLAAETPVRVPVPQTEPTGLNYIRLLLKNPIETWARPVYEQPIVQTPLFGRTITVVCDPDLVRQALADGEMLNKPHEMRLILQALGEGILTSNGAKWRHQRQITAPLFRASEVGSFAGEMLASAGRAAAKLAALPPGSRIGLAHEMMHTTFDILCRTMFSGGADIDAARMEEEISAYLERSVWMFALVAMRAPGWAPFPGRGRFRRAGQYLRAEVGRVVRDRRAGRVEHDDLIQRLIEARDPENGRGLDDAEIVDNLLTFIAAGHETSALAMTWTVYLLSRNPAIEAAVLAEIAAVTGGRRLAPEHLADLTYTKQVINEAMRLYPPVPVISRSSTRDMLLAGRTIPANQPLLVPIYAIHRHRRLWEDPDAFRPDRFEPEAAKARHRYAFMPFGAGARICMGMSFAQVEATAILATILPAVRFRLPEGYTPAPIMRVTLRPQGGMPMIVEPRTGSPAVSPAVS